MKAVTSRVYTTSDGAQHTSKPDAAKHELGIMLGKIDALAAPSAETKSAEGYVEKSPAQILHGLMTGKNREKFRDTLAEAIKLSNMMDHKPKAKKGEGVKKEPKPKAEGASAKPKTDPKK